MKPGYKQTEVGVIPEEWEVTRLSEVADLQVGFAFKSAWFGKTTGTRLLRGENVGYGNADWSETRTLESKSDEAFKAYSLSPGDVVIGMDRTFTKSGVKITVLREDDCPCLLVQRVGRFIPRKCDQMFLWFVLSSERVQSRLRLEQKGMDIPHLSRAEILHPRAAFPRLPEQHAIAGTLSDVDALIGALDQLIAKKSDLKQAAMQQLLTGRKRLPGFHGEWEVKRLGQIAEISMGRTPSRLNPAYWGRGFKWLSIADLNSKVVSQSAEEITELAASEMTIIPKGTLLMSFKLSIGRLCFAGCDLFTNEAICSFNKLRANADFLYYALGRTYFSVYGKQAVKGYTLNKESLKLVAVRLPDIEEQTAIAEVLSDMDTELAALEQRRDKTRALKQGMMQELLTGRARLK